MREYKEVCSLLGRYFPVLEGIYLHYASQESEVDGGDNVMVFSDLVSLVKDCKVFSNTITKGLLKTLASKAKLTLQEIARAEPSMLRQFGIDVEEEPEQTPPTPPDDQAAAATTAASAAAQNTLSLREMLETLVRLGVERYPDMSDKVERFRRFIEVDVLPHANRLKLDEFRTALEKPRVKKTWAQNHPQLDALYTHYANTQSPNTHAEAPEGKEKHEKALQMSKKEFLAMAKEASLFAGLLTEDVLETIFVKVLKVHTSGVHADATFTKEQFHECLAACAAYKVSDPYLPLNIKIENFLSTVLYPPLKKILRRAFKQAEEQAAARHAVAEGKDASP
jgi:hypothetical protein